MNLTVEPTDLPPPPPPTPSRRKRWMIPVLFGAGIVAAGAAVAVGTVTGTFEISSPATTTTTTTTTTEATTTTTTLPARISVSYKVEVESDSYCEDFDDDTGYDDLPYGEVEVFDGAGNLLGFGTLDGGVDTSTSCVFKAYFKVDRSTDGKYRTTAGNNNRGFLNYNESDIEGNVLHVDTFLG